MKKILLVFSLLVISAINVNAQDKVVLKNGEELNVKIVQNNSASIQFQYPNESLINEKTKREIKYIIFSSGRKEECSQGITVPTITSADDWEKVVETYTESEVEGLTHVGELKATSGWGGMMGSSMGYKGAIKKLKKKAAKLGAGVLLIHGSPNQAAASLGGGVQVIASAYK